MGFLSIHSSHSSLLCAEESDSILGCDGDEREVPELGRNLDASVSFEFQSESHELVESLMEKEREQLIETVIGAYLERLNNCGLELSWRIAAINWICKAQAHHNFGPLCVYLAVNYLDRFLASKQLPNDTPWMQQLLTVACLSLAVKMEETVVPHYTDLQVCSTKYLFEAKTIKRMEVLVLSTLKWRMHSITPFSYIGYFMGKFNEGKPPSFDLVSQCTELITSTLKATKFLQFRPSEISAAVTLSVAAEAQVVEFNNALVASKIPIDKENVGRCHEIMQEMALVKKTYANLPCVLDASCLTSRRDDNTTPGLPRPNNCNNDNNQAYISASKRTRPDSSPTS